MSAPSAVPKGRRSLFADEAQAKVQAVPLTRLRPAPWNPRQIQDEPFQNLCRSLERDPDSLWLRPILATMDEIGRAHV